MAGPSITKLEEKFVLDALRSGWYGKNAYYYVEKLEKDFANIHPHKKWFLKTIQPVEVKVETTVVPEEKSSNADGCDCKECKAHKSCPCTMNRNWEQKSGVDGSTQQKPFTNIYDYAGPMGMLIVFGIFVIALRGTNR